jgi:phosphotransferase system enzyme I (PtsI)
MGRAFVYQDIWQRCQEPPDVIQETACGDGEYARIQQAVHEVREDLALAAQRVEREVDAAAADIFRAQEMMLRDPVLLDEMRKKIDVEHRPAEQVIKRVFQRWERKFRSMEGDLLRARADDVADLGRRLLQRLAGISAHALENLPAGTVLVARRLLPSDTVFLSRQSTVAVVVESGGRLSHAALLTRLIGIPAVSQVPSLMESVLPGDLVLVDGTRGALTVRPGANLQARFRRRLHLCRQAARDTRTRCREPARTRDGVRICILANAGGPEDVQLAADHDADGIGLYRLESLYLSRQAPPCDDDIADLLGRCLEPFAGKPITVRLLDAGGDKELPCLRLPAEPEAFLGRRGVRLLLSYPELLQTQLRALLRLAERHDLRILVPMVTLAEEMEQMRGLLQQAAKDVGARRLPPLGAMIETPAAALCAARIAHYADFLSLGTNDLTQYTMVAGRENSLVSHYFIDDHPAVMRLVEMVVREAAETPVGLCGELAGRKEVLPQLLRLGLRSLSVAPPLVPQVKDLVRSLRITARSPRRPPGPPRPSKTDTGAGTPRPVPGRPLPQLPQLAG